MLILFCVVFSIILVYIYNKKFRKQWCYWQHDIMLRGDRITGYYGVHIHLHFICLNTGAWRTKKSQMIALQVKLKSTDAAFSPHDIPNLSKKIKIFCEIQCKKLNIVYEPLNSESEDKQPQTEI